MATEWSNRTSTNSGSDPYSTQSLGNSLNVGTYYLGIDDAEFANLQIGAFLEGPYTSNAMTTNLRTAGIIPITQPYTGAPWNFNPTPAISVDASFFTTHTDIVDWVLVELRDQTTQSTVLYTTACFITSDGSLLDANGAEGVYFDAPAGTYHVAIRHRNHADVSTLTPITFSTHADPGVSWDIRPNTATNIYGGTTNVKTNGSYFVLYTGDPDGNNDINANDEAIWLGQNGTVNQYLSGDYDMNADVNANDEASWLGNNGKVTTFP